MGRFLLCDKGLSRVLICTFRAHHFCFLAYISNAFAYLKIVQSFLIAVGESLKNLINNIIEKLIPALYAYVHDTVLVAGHNVCEMFC